MPPIQPRERLKRLSGRRYEPVSQPGLEGFKVQSLNEGERAIVEEYATGDRRKMKRVIVAFSLLDDQGLQVYPVNANDDSAIAAAVDEITSLDGAIVDSIVSASIRLNKFSEADIASLLGERVAS